MATFSSGQKTNALFLKQSLITSLFSSLTRTIPACHSDCIVLTCILLRYRADCYHSPTYSLPSAATAAAYWMTECCLLGGATTRCLIDTTPNALHLNLIDLYINTPGSYTISWLLVSLAINIYVTTCKHQLWTERGQCRCIQALKTGDAHGFRLSK